MAALSVLIDTTMAGIAEGERSGVYQYQRHLVNGLLQAGDLALTLLFALPRARHDAQIAAFVREAQAEGAPPAVQRGRLPLRLLRRVPWPAEGWRARHDVFHGPAHLLLASRAPAVVTVHDLAYLHDQGAAVPAHTLAADERAALALRQRFFAELARQTEQTLRRAAHVITVSEHTRSVLRRHFHLPPQRVTAVPLGLRAEAVAPPSVAAFAHWQQRLGLQPPYLLYLGNLDPNKNLATLLHGFAAYRRQGGRCPLLLAGRSVFYERVLQALAQQLGVADAVHFLGRVDDAALPVLYRGAQTVLMPSRLEGFGLPAIEAMACGTPVVVAAAGALPEVAGEAALQVPPDSADGFAEALLRIEGDEALAQRLRRAGPRQAARFSWRHTAEATAAVYRRVALEAA
mgnify:CR=1 FL=1